MLVTPRLAEGLLVKGKTQVKGEATVRYMRAIASGDGRTKSAGMVCPKCQKKASKVSNALGSLCKFIVGSSVKKGKT